MWEVDATHAPRLDSLSAAPNAYRPAANLCMSHAYFKPLLADLLRQTIPSDVAGCDIDQWTDKHSITAQLLVHSIKDAGQMLSHLYESCPYIAQGGELLRMYTDYAAKVTGFLSTPLAGLSIHCHVELLQSLCSLAEKAHLVIAGAMLEVKETISQPAFAHIITIAAVMAAKQEQWNQAGTDWVQARTSHWQQQCNSQIQKARADWRKYEAALPWCHATATVLLTDCCQVWEDQLGTLACEALAQQVFEVYYDTQHQLQPLQLSPNFSMCDEGQLQICLCTQTDVKVKVSCIGAAFVSNGEPTQKLKVKLHRDKSVSVSCLFHDPSRLQVDMEFSQPKRRVVNSVVNTLLPGHMSAPQTVQEWSPSSIKTSMTGAELMACCVTGVKKYVLPDGQHLHANISLQPHLKCKTGMLLLWLEIPKHMQIPLLHVYWHIVMSPSQCFWIVNIHGLCSH